MKSYTIHLIRQGLTAGNEEGRYIGSTDLPLSSNGAERLEKLRGRYSYPGAKIYFCSPQKRALQTLSLLYPQAKPVRIEDFSECDFGDWEGKTAKEIAGRDPEFGQWVSGSGSQVTPPHGESSAVFLHRVCAAFEKIAGWMMRSGAVDAVMVVPGGVLMSILSAYGLPKAKFYDWMTEDGRGYSMRITPGLWMRSMVGEVYAKLPEGERERDDRDHIILNLTRKAAEEAFREKKPGKE